MAFRSKRADSCRCVCVCDLCVFVCASACAHVHCTCINGQDKTLVPRDVLLSTVVICGKEDGVKMMTGTHRAFEG